jgi:hypothetical protein
MFLHMRFLARLSAVILMGSLASACAGADDGQPEVAGSPRDPSRDGGSPKPADAGRPQPNDAGQKPDAKPAGCEVLTFPSGVSFRTRTDAAMSKTYESISDKGDYPQPKCFIDVDDLSDPKTGTKYSLNVKVSEYFTLEEFVGTGLSYSRLVLLDPDLVAKVDDLRKNLNRSVALSSGYRSPAHQRATCRSICGKDFCPGVCAERSRHSWGDAADFPEVPTKALGDTACKSKFNYVYRERDHLHVDLNPAHPICTIDVL